MKALVMVYVRGILSGREKLEAEPFLNKTLISLGRDVSLVEGMIRDIQAGIPVFIDNPDKGTRMEILAVQDGT